MITDILTNYTDTELAYLYKFRIKIYLPETQAKVKHFIFTTRGLSESTIDRLITENTITVFTDGKLRCPNCKSEKIALNAEKVDCTVCGHMLADIGKQEFRNDAKDIFFAFLDSLD